MEPIFTKMIPCPGVGILKMIPCSAARPRTEKYISAPPGLHAPGALFLEILENCHGNCLGSRAPSFQNDGLQGSSDPPPLWGPQVSSPIFVQKFWGNPLLPYLVQLQIRERRTTNNAQLRSTRSLPASWSPGSSRVFIRFSSGSAQFHVPILRGLCPSHQDGIGCASFV